MAKQSKVITVLDILISLIVFIVGTVGAIFYAIYDLPRQALRKKRNGKG